MRKIIRFNCLRPPPPPEPKPPVPYPFAKRQFIQVTATWPVTPGPGSFLQRPRREVVLFSGDFMTVMRTAQGKWPGATITMKTLDTKPDWAKPKPPEEAKA